MIERLLELSGDAILVRDAGDRITYWNKAAQDTYGYTAEEALGRNPDELLKTEPPEPLERIYERVRRSGDWKGELVHTRKDGAKIIVASRWSLDPDSVGDGVAILEANRDITKLMRVEHRLRVSEERFRSIFSNAGTGVAIVDWQGRFLQCNPAFRALSGYTEDQLKNLTLPDLAHPEDREAFVDAIDHVRGDEKAFEIESRCVRKDGETIWARKCISTLPDEDGASSRLIVLVTDVTECKTAQERLLASEERFRKVFEHAPTGIAIGDVDGRIRQVNPAFSELIGYTPEELLGMHFSQIVHPDDRENNIVQARRLRERNIPFIEIENRYVRKDGEPIWVHKFITFLPDENGKPSDRMALVTDVTERRRMEQALRDADRRKDEFLATLAHELRNPLAPLRNALNLFKRLGGEGPDGEKLRAMMERQVNHLVRLVDDLLEVSRITRGNIELKKERTDLATVIDNAVEISHPLIKGNGHTLTISVTPGEFFVDGDPTRLTQVFANLLNNSAKYSGYGGHIEVSANKQGGEVVISVRDKGVGISAEMLPRIFDVFSQSDPRFSRTQGGIGIGLALVRNLVQLHDGRVEAHSGGPGCGSEFIVRLPLAAPIAANASMTTS